MKGIWKNKKNELEQKTKLESSATLKKEDFLKDGKKEKENTQNSVRTVKIPLSIVILVLVMALFLVYFFVSKNNINFFNSSNNNYSSKNIDEKAIDIGSKGYISSAEIIQTKTGTGPWDENDEPGNDSSEDNDVVRSFDQVVWTVDLTISLKDNSQGASLSGGRIEVEAELPENCADVMKWDLESMLWMENGKVSDDGRSITGSYTMTDTEVTVPGKQTLVFVLKVEGAGNKTEIVPTFRFKLTGNEDTEKVSLTGKEVTVMAHGMGMPSMGIYVYELYKFYDVEEIIRIGSCGAYLEEMKLFDIILAKAVYTESSFALTLNNDLCHIAYSDEDLNVKIEKVAYNSGIKLYQGMTACLDCFDVYMTDIDKFFDRMPDGVKPIAAEMEAFALFYVAKMLGKKAACLMSVVDSKYIKNVASAEEREQGLDKMIKLALDSII